MLVIFTERIINRLKQLVTEIQKACNTGLDYHDRLREFKYFCDTTPSLSQLIGQLPNTPYDFTLDWRVLPDHWPGGIKSYAMRWDAIRQMVDGGPSKVDEAWLQISSDSQDMGLRQITDIFVIPIYHFLVDQIETSSAVLHLILRYKRWAEWFETDRLNGIYKSNKNNGESVLDKTIRRFLFESGIDYPFSQPALPHGKVDVVAGLETNDPLVLEIKVWDSSKGYKENRLRDGLRQIIEYATKYGKDKGYVVVFNIDQDPLSLVSQTGKSEWPPFIELGGRTYYFIDIHIAERLKPISQQDKGQPVRVNKVDLVSLLNDDISE